jgi:hypothetical protein
MGHAVYGRLVAAGKRALPVDLWQGEVTAATQSEIDDYSAR